MSKAPQRKSPEFKLNLALEAIKGEHTIIQLASQHGINPKQITRWRDQLLNEGAAVFEHKRTRAKSDPGKDELLKIIEQHRVELEFLKKKLKQLR